MSKISFDKNFVADYGQIVQISPLVQRITANNPGPFTFHGTNTYLVGINSIAVIDPGPMDIEHIENILKFVDADKISHIFVTHTHMDHSPGARILQSKTDAPIIGAGPHKASRALKENEVNPLKTSADTNYVPDKILADEEKIESSDWTIETVTTPGHTANHLAFSLTEENTLFSGDHVMAWSTSIVAPPDGSMNSYMNSLRKLQKRTEHMYLPAHGGPVKEVQMYLEQLISHREGREFAIIDQLKLGERKLTELVAEIYRDTPKSLHTAAGFSLIAHLEDLIERKIVSTSEINPLEATFKLL